LSAAVAVAVDVEVLAAAADRFWGLLRRFDPRLVSGEDAARVADALMLTERRVAAARLASVARAASCGTLGAGAEGRGEDAAGWAARGQGVGRNQAERELALARRLGSLPRTRAAVAAGTISLEQATEVALTASEVDPGDAERVEDEMLDLAQRADLTSLRDRGRAIRLKAIPPDKLAQRQRQARYHRKWTNRLGMRCASYALEPGEGVPLHNVLDAETDRRVRADKIAANKAARDGRPYERQTREQHAADALVAMLQGGGRGKAGRADIVLLGDIRTILANDDREGGGCHILGGGPISVADLRQRLLDAGDAFIKGVVHNGVDILNVEHLGRKISAELRTALLLGQPPHFDGPVCAEPGCGARFGLECDHIVPVAADGPTSYRNAAMRCKPHHWAKTERDRAAGLLTPRNPASDRGGDAGGERGPP